MARISSTRLTMRSGGIRFMQARVGLCIKTKTEGLEIPGLDLIPGLTIDILRLIQTNGTLEIDCPRRGLQHVFKDIESNIGDTISGFRGIDIMKLIGTGEATRRSAVSLNNIAA